MNKNIEYIKQISRNHWKTEDGVDLFLKYSGRKDLNRHTGRYHFSGKAGGMVSYVDVYDLILGQDKIAQDFTEDELEEKLRELGYQVRR